MKHTSPETFVGPSSPPRDLASKSRVRPSRAKIVTFAPPKTPEEIDAEEEEVMFKTEQKKLSGGVLITREVCAGESQRIYRCC